MLEIRIPSSLSLMLIEIFIRLSTMFNVNITNDAIRNEKTILVPFV